MYVVFMDKYLIIPMALSMNIMNYPVTIIIIHSQLYACNYVINQLLNYLLKQAWMHPWMIRYRDVIIYPWMVIITHGCN